MLDFDTRAADMRKLAEDGNLNGFFDPNIRPQSYAREEEL
jgi:hypothetical protein